MPARRILIVEDESIAAINLHEQLVSLGYQPVGPVATGAAATSLAGELRPDLVLMDIHLEGDMDGIVAAREIRQRFHIPSLFVSAFSEDETLERAKLAEPLGYILKPFEVRELKANIELALYKHRLEEALRQSEARLQFALEATRTGAWELDLAERTVQQTLMDSRIFGYETPQPDWSYERFLEHVLPEDRPEVDRQFRQAVARQADWNYEFRIRRADGQVRWLWAGGRAEQNPGGAPQHARGLVQDITERKRLEARVWQSQKMEAIGHLAGGMAHQFNNILAGTMLNLDLAKQQPQTPEASERLDEIETLSQRSALLISQLLSFSRQAVIHRKPLELAALVTQARPLLSQLLGKRIHLEFHLTASSLWVEADQIAVEQVLLNLCRNACDAMNEGGVLRVQLAAAEVSAETAEAHVQVKPGKFVCLSVADTGCGMTPEIQRRLFEPFFTTKDVGQATGLGLASVRGLVEQHHGWVEAESCVGQGSTFRVYLPATAAPPPAPTAAPQASLVRGEGTILLVEDEPMLLKLCGLLLTRCGYTVLTAADGDQALTVWEHHRAEIDLLFTDMVMPGTLNGLQLAQRLRTERPGLKVIVTSGYSAERLGLDEEFAAAAIEYLPKPSAPSLMTQVINNCLQPR